MPGTQRYFGKYRGTVMNNIDPQQIGRLQLQVPDVLGTTVSGWALPCLPVAGPQMGVFALPPVGAAVWVEFEGGDADRPIWVGGFWPTAGELPSLAQGQAPDGDRFIIETAQQTGLVISDAPGPDGGIVLQSAGGARITISDAGIFIQNGKGASIAMVGPEVSVNSGALAVV
jgi:uncharacterized protein involved in type VI secretion and phage assembly